MNIEHLKTRDAIEAIHKACREVKTIGRTLDSLNLLAVKLKDERRLNISMTNNTSSMIVEILDENRFHSHSDLIEFFDGTIDDMLECEDAIARIDRKLLQTSKMREHLQKERKLRDFTISNFKTRILDAVTDDFVRHAIEALRTSPESDVHEVFEEFAKTIQSILDVEFDDGCFAVATDITAYDRFIRAYDGICAGDFDAANV